MQILNWIPPHAQQIRYTAPQYEEDGDGNSICVNEDWATDVYHDVIQKVKKDKRPIYYRRRTHDLARNDVDRHSYALKVDNSFYNEWGPGCTPVRVKRLGRRVIFVYDEEYAKKIWIAAKKKDKLRKKLRKLKEKNKYLTIKDYVYVMPSSLREEWNFEDILDDLGDQDE